MELHQINTNIIQEMATIIISKIADSAIREMKKRRDVLLSGEDSGLKNLWDEYVVQVRGSESFHFEEYQEEVEHYCQREITKISKLEKLIVTTGVDQNTQEFEEWLEESEKAIHYEEIFPSDNLILIEVLIHLNSLAADYTSPNIERFLNNEEEE